MTQVVQKTNNSQGGIKENSLADKLQAAAGKYKFASLVGLSNNELISKFPEVAESALENGDLDRLAEDEISKLIKECDINNIQPATKSTEDQFLTPEQEEKFKKYLQPLTKNQISSEAKQDVLGLETGYKIGDIVLKVPGAAISVIVASTGHGKTTALINFALNIISQVSTKGNVHFFSFEEKRHKIFRSFLNIYIDQYLAKNNRASIDTYIRDGNPQYIEGEVVGHFLEKEKEFFNKYIDNNRINISHEEPSEMMVEDLIDAIKYLKNNTNVAIICIDYIQLLALRKKSRTQSRQEELKEICQLLQKCANTTGLPILTAAQFNREVTTPDLMCFRKIGEAGDIERKAELILGIWNYSTSDNAEPVGKIQIKILKGRGVGSGQSEDLEYNGNTGKFINKLKLETSRF